MAFQGGGIITIDLHSFQEETAKRALDSALRKAGSGVYRIRTQCMNIGRFGTTVMSGAEGPMAQSDVSIRLSSKEKPVTILSRPARFTISKLDSMERVSAEWFIQGTENQCIQITASHCKCTTVTAEFHL